MFHSPSEGYDSARHAGGRKVRLTVAGFSIGAIVVFFILVLVLSEDLTLSSVIAIVLVATISSWPFYMYARLIHTLAGSIAVGSVMLIVTAAAYAYNIFRDPLPRADVPMYALLVNYAALGAGMGLERLSQRRRSHHPSGQRIGRM